MFFRSAFAMTAMLAIGGCGGGAMINSKIDSVKADTEFCGVKVKFTGNPKKATAREIESISEIFGSFEKIDISALYFSQYQLEESMVCLCREKPIQKFLIYPNSQKGVENIKERSIEDVGNATQFEKTDTPLFYRYQYVVPTNDSACHIFQVAKTPVGTGFNEAFFDSIASPKLKSPQGNPSRTVEQRLLEIKSLMDKGLITKEQYDQKSLDILKSF